MAYVRHPFVGYRVKPDFAHLLPTCADRPQQYALSALYLYSGIEGFDEARQELYQFNQNEAERRYPGEHS